jgi:D-sedoheptulose 7-phosphate isomerase
MIRDDDDSVAHHFRRSARVLQSAADDAALHATIEKIAAAVELALRGGKKLLLAGNGGSAADAQHIAAEFVSRFKFNRDPLPAIALTTDTSILTAIGNDYGFEHIFSRQVEALGQPGDILLAISTSGNSPNCIRALERARALGLTTIAFTGNGGGKMAPLADINVIVPGTVTMNIQESQLALEHIFCMLVERCYFGPDFGK